MPEILPYKGPAIPAGMYETWPLDTPMLDELRHEVFDIVTATLNPVGRRLYAELATQDEGQMENSYSGTFYHQLEVGVLIQQALRQMSAPGDIVQRAVSAAGLHDMGKRRAEILNLITLPRILSDEERHTLGQHTVYGAEDLAVALEDDTDKQLIAACARYHHTEQPANLEGMSVDRELWDYIGLVQLADRTQAVLMDWSRKYKADRMTREGLLQDGTLVMDKAIEVLLGGNSKETLLGVPTAQVVELGRQYMPAAAWITQKVLGSRARTAA